MTRLAVIQFPGSNCEYETQRAANYYGFSADIIRWNCSPGDFHAYHAYILPGGFSYQDRVRSGAIASKLPILGWLQEASAQGKPILGICNGCQILAEAGLVPDFAETNAVEIALQHNTRDGERWGFVCDWVFVRIERPELCVFTRQFSPNDVLPVPINHGEGKFVLSETVRKRLNELTMMTYCKPYGHPEPSYPTNPNGSTLNIAALSNKKGNVLAMMPHPERASFVRQIPFWIAGEWPDKKRKQFQAGQDGAGPWEKLFVSVKEYALCL